MDELAAYFMQAAYFIRKNPLATSKGRDATEKEFFALLFATVRSFRLDTPAGNAVRIPAAMLEGLRRDLVAIADPAVKYREYSKDASTGSNGLLRHNLFLSSGFEEQVRMRSSTVSHEIMPDPDGYLINLLTEDLTSSHATGSAVRRLRREFLDCSQPRATQLQGGFSHDGRETVSPNYSTTDFQMATVPFCSAFLPCVTHRQDSNESDLDESDLDESDLSGRIGSPPRVNSGRRRLPDLSAVNRAGAGIPPSEEA
jgi:hypothetical protein